MQLERIALCKYRIENAELDLLDAVEIIEVVAAKKSKIGNLRGAVNVEGEQNFSEIIDKARLEIAQSIST